MTPDRKRGESLPVSRILTFLRDIQTQQGHVVSIEATQTGILLSIGGEFKGDVKVHLEIEAGVVKVATVMGDYPFIVEEIQNGMYGLREALVSADIKRYE